MAKFSYKLECCKCGTDCESNPKAQLRQKTDSNGRWIDTERIVEASIVTTFVKLPDSGTCICGRRGGEHLHRKCLVCGYYWSEKTMDAEDE